MNVFKQKSISCFIPVQTSVLIGLSGLLRSIQERPHFENKASCPCFVWIVVFFFSSLALGQPLQKQMQKYAVSDQCYSCLEQVGQQRYYWNTLSAAFPVPTAD